MHDSRGYMRRALGVRYLHCRFKELSWNGITGIFASIGKLIYTCTGSTVLGSVINPRSLSVCVSVVQSFSREFPLPVPESLKLVGLKVSHRATC